MGSRRILQLLKEGSLQIWRMVEVAECLPTFVKKPTLARTWAGLGKAVGLRHRPARAHLGVCRTVELPARNSASPLVQLHRYQRVEGRGYASAG